MMQHVFSVQGLTQAIKGVLGGQFPLVWVQGQVSDLSRPGSGHIYFSLKDDQARLKVVWFKGNQWQDRGVLGLENGQEVLCAGCVDVYPPQGSYQLVAELVQDRGLGRLQQGFEALKEDLAAKGYFAQGRKRALPANPRRVGIITAPQGAAVRDFLRLSAERGWPASLRIYPSLMQGEGAEDNVLCALEQVNLEQWAEVVVLIRGGGSIEDLWTFNLKTVAEAVANSSLPVLTGIGHEKDVTIADLIADRRAATPSHAAQLLWPLRRELIQGLDDWELRLERTWLARWQQKWLRVAEFEKALSWLSPRRRLQRSNRECQRLRLGLDQGGRRLLTRRAKTLQTAGERLTRLGHQGLGREYASRLEGLIQALLRAQDKQLSDKGHDLKLKVSNLKGLDPKAPLQRGFSLVTRGLDNGLVRSAAEARKAETLRVQTANDAYLVQVLGPTDDKLQPLCFDDQLGRTP